MSHLAPGRYFIPPQNLYTVIRRDEDGDHYDGFRHRAVFQAIDQSPEGPVVSVEAAIKALDFARRAHGDEGYDTRWSHGRLPDGAVWIEYQSPGSAAPTRWQSNAEGTIILPPSEFQSVEIGLDQLSPGTDLGPDVVVEDELSLLDPDRIDYLIGVDGLERSAYYAFVGMLPIPPVTDDPGWAQIPQVHQAARRLHAVLSDRGVHADGQTRWAVTEQVLRQTAQEDPNLLTSPDLLHEAAVRELDHPTRKDPDMTTPDHEPADPARTATIGAEVPEGPDAAATVTQTAEAAAILVLAGQYLMNHPEVDPEEATRAATASVACVQGRLNTADWQAIVSKLTAYGTGDPAFFQTPTAPAATADRPAQRGGIRTTIVGNLAADPEGDFDQAGRAYARVTVISNERRRVDGGWEDGPRQTTQVVVFGPRAEDVLNDPAMRRGQWVEVTGRPQVEQFSRRDGSAGAALKLFATAVVARQPAGADRPTAAPSPDIPVQSARRAGPVVHHNADHTIVIGVQRQDVDVQRALKSVGFRWSAPRQAWALPASMPVGERGDKITAVQAQFTDAGQRPLAVTGAPAPGSAAAQREAAATAGTSFTPDPAGLAAPTASRAAGRA